MGDNWMLAIGFVSQWAKANPRVPSILVVAFVCGIGYFGYWVSGEAGAAHTIREFLNGGWAWALKGVFALQTTSAAASGLSGFNLPESVTKALPVTKN